MAQVFDSTTVNSSNRSTRDYKDLDLDFGRNAVTNDVNKLTDVEAVKRSVRNLVLTNHYERPYNKYLGGDLISQLFENMDPMTEYNISKNIRQALDNFEPRAIVTEIKTNAHHALNGINVTITFHLKNDPNPQIVEVLLERVR